MGLGLLYVSSSHPAPHNPCTVDYPHVTSGVSLAQCQLCLLQVPACFVAEFSMDEHIYLTSYGRTMDRVGLQSRGLDLRWLRHHYLWETDASLLSRGKIIL